MGLTSPSQLTFEMSLTGTGKTILSHFTLKITSAHAVLLRIASRGACKPQLAQFRDFRHWHRGKISPSHLTFEIPSTGTRSRDKKQAPASSFPIFLDRLISFESTQTTKLRIRAPRGDCFLGNSFAQLRTCISQTLFGVTKTCKSFAASCPNYKLNYLRTDHTRISIADFHSSSNQHFLCKCFNCSFALAFRVKTAHPKAEVLENKRS